MEINLELEEKIVIVIEGIKAFKITAKRSPEGKLYLEEKEII